MAMVSRPCYVTGSGANFAVYQSLSVKLKNERTQTLIVRSEVHSLTTLPSNYQHNTGNKAASLP